MGLDEFNPSSKVNDLVQDLKWDADLRARFEADEEVVLGSYHLAEAELTAIRARDFRAIHDLGLHPYLLSQLARLVHGTGEKAGTSEAATALIRSLLGDDYEQYMAQLGE